MGSFNFRYMKNFPRNKRDKTYDRRVSLNRQLVDRLRRVTFEFK